jgi:hypothetical protein
MEYANRRAKRVTSNLPQSAWNAMKPVSHVPEKDQHAQVARVTGIWFKEAQTAQTNALEEPTLIQPRIPAPTTALGATSKTPAVSAAKNAHHTANCVFLRQHPLQVPLKLTSSEWYSVQVNLSASPASGLTISKIKLVLKGAILHFMPTTTRDRAINTSILLCIPSYSLNLYRLISMENRPLPKLGTNTQWWRYFYLKFTEPVVNKTFGNITLADILPILHFQVNGNNSRVIITSFKE